MFQQIVFRQANKSIFDLNSTDIATLVNYAENSTGKAAVASKGILEFAYDYEYCNCLPNVDSSAMKTPANTPPKEEEQEDYGFYVIITPNPATTWVAFNYALPAYADKASLEITDMQGKLIAGIQLTGKIGQKVWDTRKVEKGVYLYTLKVGTLQKTGKIIIK